MQQSRREEYGEMLSPYMSLPDKPHSLIIVLVRDIFFTG